MAMRTKIAAAILVSLSLISLAQADETWTNAVLAAPTATPPASTDVIPIIQGSGTSARTKQMPYSTLNVVGTDVREYGAVCDGITDDSAALSLALSVSNIFIVLPQGATCLFATTLTIGNGSSSAVSTVNNVFIGSLLAPQQWLSGFPQGAPTLKYTGSGDAIKFQGQMSGGGIRGVRLLCTNNAATGIHYISTVGLTSENFMIQGCKIPTQPTGIASIAPGTSNGDVYGGSWRNFNIELPAVTGAIGINLSSSTTWDVDFEVWEHGNVTFDVLGSGTRTCIYAGFGDTNTVRDVHCIITGGRTDTIKGVTLDYSTSCGIGSCDNFPNSYVFDHVDVAAADTKWSNNGTPSASSTPNFANNIPTDNGGTYPLLANILVDHSTGTCTPTLVGASVAGTTGLSTATCNWTMQGWNVNVNYNVVVNGSGITGGAAGQLTQTGLPISVGSAPSSGACSLAFVGGWTAQATYNNLRCFGNTGATTMAYWESNAVGSAGVAAAITELAAGSQIAGTLSYTRAK